MASLIRTAVCVLFIVVEIALIGFTVMHLAASVLTASLLWFECMPGVSSKMSRSVCGSKVQSPQYLHSTLCNDGRYSAKTWK